MLTIARLKRLLGFASESRKKAKPPSDSNDDDPGTPPSTTDNAPMDDGSTDGDQQQTARQWDDEQNHGRYGADAYTGCPVVDVAFTEPLNQCPCCAAHTTSMFVMSF